jgi:hypothetical protein
MLRDIAIVLSFPMIVYFLPEPTAARWGAKHGSPVPMPAEMKATSVRRGRYLILLKSLLLLGAMWLMCMRVLVVGSSETTSQPLWLQILAGILCGAVLGLLRARMQPPPDTRPLSTGPGALTGPISLWLAIFSFGGIAEEWWRACSQITLIGAGWNVGIAVAVTSIAFTAAYLSGIPARISADGRDLLLTCLWGGSLGILFLVFRSLLLTIAANMICNTMHMFLLRRSMADSPASIS